MSATVTGQAEPLAAGRAALARAAWSEARALFEEAAAAGGAAEAWEGFSQAVWWLGDQEATLSARERAYRAYRAAGDACGAARMATWLASDHLDFRGDDAVASAWLRRGRALLRDHGPCAEWGFLTVLEADIAYLAQGDLATAQRLASEALDLARGIADAGVEVVALAVLGSALIASGSVEEGLGLLDESAALAVGEDFSETAAPGWALCHTVSACAGVGDFRRAAQWCRALHTWSATWRARHFFGVCRTAYGEVLATGGDWHSAEQELLDAMEDLRTTRPALAAPTAVRLGRLRVRQGHLTEARALFEAALPLPQAIVAFGELELAGGDATAAADAADRVLRRLGDASVLDRLPALELLARARAAAGDGDGAAAAADQVEQEAARLATPYMRGRGRLVRAHVLLSAGDHDGARRAAEDAADLFTACSAPYEAAQARVVLAEALAALGRPARAEAEAAAARETFALLGATGLRRSAKTGELSPREVDILRLVAKGHNDAQIAQRLFLSTHTVHRHIANIRTKLGVPSRAAAVASATREGLL
ncbi:helix-turn-helix transcriptional regulator [Prauserella sp. PE36]|uniref:helix-turn-helix domain-containing protein n=1 Tax=Prauserella sp. PE36 TaxID=1504709 RepID=UPI000DE47611|nr:helix-turn-helix transcriptional regulator [Prauserella sp. PE36]